MSNTNENENKIDAAVMIEAMKRFAGYEVAGAEKALVQMRDRAAEFVAKIDEFLAKRDENANADANVKLNELRFQLSRADELASAARECKEHENKLDAIANVCIFG